MASHPPRTIGRRRVATAALTTVLALVGAAPASATLTPVRPSPSDVITFYGHGGYSSDGAGPTGETIQAQVPAGSTVEHAYLYGSFQGGGSTLGSEADVQFDGAPKTFDQVSFEEGIYYDDFITGRVDVTAPVAARVGSGGGTYSFPVEAAGGGTQHGFGLVVIYSNPNEPQVSIGMLDGFASTAGDQAKLYFATPLDKTTTGFRATMALGIGWSAGTQSLIDVNGQRLSSAAGGNDDSPNALITVGGIGDSIANPFDPSSGAEADDELYDLTSFVHQGDTDLTIDTFNASDNDAIFVSVIEIAARAALGANGVLPPYPAAPSPSPLTSSGVGTTVQTRDLGAPSGGSAELLAGSTPVASRTIADEGTYTVAPSGVLSFAPVRGFHGVASPITYRLTDAYGQHGTSTFTATVTLPAPPAATPLPSVGGPALPQVRFVDVPAGGRLTLLDEHGAPVRSLRVAGQGDYVLDDVAQSITFVPVAGYAGRATPVAYRVTDAYGQSRDSTFEPVVEAILAPVAGVTRAPAAPPAVAAACASLRSMTIHYRVPAGARPKGFGVTVNGRPYAKLARRARRVTIDLRGRPAQRVTVVVRATGIRGGALSTSRTYRTCRPGVASKPLATLSLQRRS